MYKRHFLLHSKIFTFKNTVFDTEYYIESISGTFSSYYGICNTSSLNGIVVTENTAVNVVFAGEIKSICNPPGTIGFVSYTNIKLTQINNNKILVCIIEYGTTKKIEKILKELNIEYFTINPYDNPKIKPTHIILSGGPDHVYEINHRPLPKWVIDIDSKVLGICYGM